MAPIRIDDVMIPQPLKYHLPVNHASLPFYLHRTIAEVPDREQAEAEGIRQSGIRRRWSVAERPSRPS